MAQRAICIASKNRNCRILISFAILAAEIVFESAFGGAQETQPVPSSVSRMRAQRGGIGSSDDRQINVLVEMVSDSIEAVDPRGTHRAGICLLLSIHKVIDYKCAIRPGKQFTQAHCS